MTQAPKWFLPTAIAALLWNLMGCAAYLSDVMVTPEDVAKMTAAEQAMVQSRPAWAVGATAVAVWGGAAGCVGLIMRKRFATLLLIASAIAVVVQDLWLFVISGAGSSAGPVVAVLQGLVLLIAIALVLLAQRATARGWIS